jgi:hypothetical protein
VTVWPPAVAEDPNLLRLLLLTIVLIVVAGGVFLVTWDIPAPTREVEVVVPDEKLPR